MRLHRFQSVVLPLSLLVAACSSAAPSDPLADNGSDDTSDKPAEHRKKSLADSGAPSSSDSDGLASETDEAVTDRPGPQTQASDAGVDGSAGPVIRECGRVAKTQAASIFKAWGHGGPFSLGQGILQIGGEDTLMAANYVSGTAAKGFSYSTGASGSDMSLVSQLTLNDGWSLATFNDERPPRWFSVNNTTPSGALAGTFVPSARRLTWSSYNANFGASYAMTDTAKTPKAPAGTLDNPRYLSQFNPVRVDAVFIQITAHDLCGVGALSDAMGRTAFIAPGNGILDPAKRTVIQDTLAKNGNVWIGVYGSKTVPAVDAILANTKCSNTDLAACQETLTDIMTAFSEVPKPKAAPTLKALTDNTDPYWTVLSAGVAPLP